MLITIISIAVIMLSIILGYVLYIKTGASTAITSMSSSPILKKLLKWFIIIVLLFIGYQIIAFINKFIPWDKFNEHLPDIPNFPNLPDVSLNLDNSFFATWDWATFSWVQEYLGNAGNLIIWTLVGLAIFWIIASLFQRKMDYGITGWLFFIVLLGAFILAITNINKNDEIKVAKSSFVDVRSFPRAAEGLELIINMGVIQIAQIRGHMTNPRTHGEGRAFWSCPEVIKPDAYANNLNFEVTPESRGQYINHIRLTKESSDMLIENGIMDIKVRFTQTLGTPKQSPCKYLK